MIAVAKTIEQKTIARIVCLLLLLVLYMNILFPYIFICCHYVATYRCFKLYQI